MIFCYVSARFKITRSCLNNVMKNAKFQFGDICSGAKYAFFSASENQIVEKNCISTQFIYAEPGGGELPLLLPGSRVRVQANNPWTWIGY